MKGNTINWPNELIDDIKQKRCVVFIGSGISANSHDKNGNSPPTWKDFLLKGTEELSKTQSQIIKSHIRSNDYLFACELLREMLGKDRYYNILKTCFQNKYKHANIHHDIFLLDSPIYITPNFDNIFDTHVQSETNGSTSVLPYYDENIIDEIRTGRNIIIKIHGTIQSVDKLIFTKSDYAKARIEHSKFYKVLESLILTKTFLFLGAGLNDPDVQLLFENVSFTYHNAKHHYFVVPAIDKNTQNAYKKLLNLEFLTYNPKNEHKALKEGLSQLVQLVNAD